MSAQRRDDAEDLQAAAVLMLAAIVLFQAGVLAGRRR